MDSGIAQKTAILLASGGGFVFSLVLAKYWPPQNYATFISGFATASYFSFPILYGLIPQVLRDRMAKSDISLVKIVGLYKKFIFLYFIISIILLFWISSNLTSFMQVGLVLITILIVGIGEASLRYKDKINQVFYMRLLGISLSLIVVALSIHLKSERTVVLSYFARIVPLSVVLSICYIVFRNNIKQPKTEIVQVPRGKPGGIADATIITMIVGVFQYVFLIIGKEVIPAQEFIPISIELMISITVCQKLIEPQVFRLYLLPGETRTLASTINLIKRNKLSFVELPVLAFFAQLVSLLWLGDVIDYFSVLLFSVGSALVSVAHFLHSSTFVNSSGFRISIISIFIFTPMLIAMVYLKNVLNLQSSYLIMAAIYLVVVLLNYPRIEMVDMQQNLS